MQFLTYNPNISTSHLSVELSSIINDINTNDNDHDNNIASILYELESYYS